MKKATSAASSKGQRPITSFFTQPQSKPKKSDEPKALEPTQQHSLDDVEIVQVEPPNKRQRSSPSDQAPATAPATAKPQRPASAPAVDIAARHARWQSKLLGDEDAGMGRVRTWDAVQQRPDKPKPTPLEQQVADLQRRHPDCVLAIAVGYKYRFYGKDAEIASQVLGFFAYPDRNFLVCGVPTVRIDFHVRRLVAAGHKVGIVRQVETAAIKAAGQNRNQPFERKLTAMYTKATLEAGELGALVKPSAGVDGVDADEEEGAASETLRQDSGAYSNEHRSAYLVCIIEEPVDGTSGSGGTVEAAIVAVETSTGQVLYSQVQDSPMRPELESRLMFAQPSDLLAVEPLSVPTRRLLESYASASAGVRTEHADGAAYRSGGALAALTDAVGRPHSTFDNAQSTALDAVMKLPPLVVRALAHALDYLKPFGLGGILSQSSCFRDFSEVQELTLSPNTLHQLEVLRNSDDGKERGSLLWLMDRTITAAGARLMRRWVSRPLKQVEDINERLDAVEELMAEGASHPVLSRLPGVLRALPDVERHLGRMLHGNASPSELLTVLQTFKDLHLNLGMSADLDGPAGAQGSQPPLAPTGVRSILLGRLLAAAADLQCAAAARDTLACINEDAAAVDDKLRLFADDVRFADVAEKRADVVAAEATLSALRPVLAEMLNVKKVEYVHVQNQGDYLVEVPVELEKRAPKAWEKISSTKKVVRFRPPEVKAAMRTLELAKEHLALTAAAAWRRLQQEFSVHYSALKAAVQALASLDCLSSFASLAVAGSYCRPEFVADTEPPQLHIVAGRHPVLDVLLEGSFVANDIALCGDGERCAVITGPNMGGKSCFIRQAALLAIMAQAGSLVPAQSCRLHAFDAVFTRMGAADNIALGRSTFLEELSEASTILSRATPRSLVVIDELGRGTSTRDGMAVAQATLDHIVRNVRCLTLFVTHYPEVAHLDGPVKANAGSFYMAHLLEQDAQGRAGVPKVTFLYRVTRGVAAASYGINVARMAGLPPSVVHRAAAKAEAVEEALRAAETAEVAREVQRRLKAVVDGNLSAEELAALQALIREKLHVS